MPATEVRCSALSEAADESMTATASQVRNWLLIEHDGPWGRDAFADARLPAGFGPALLGRTRPLQVRPILIRRTKRVGAGAASVFAAHSGPDAPWIERVQLDRIDDVLALDLTSLGRGRSIGGDPVPDPLFLVCTHGRHDPCCAERGRPLAAAVTATYPGATWECSHIGGDRFAANLVAFPHGLYFGRIEPQDGPQVARAYTEGRVDLGHYRGRSCYPKAVQAAEHFARQAERIDGVDDIGVDAAAFDEAGATVSLRTPGGQLSVRMEVAAGPAQQLTCHSPDPQRPPVYRLIDIAPLNGGGSDP